MVPNSHGGGTALLGINLLNELKKAYKITVVSALKNYYDKNSILKAKKELKKEKIKYHIIKTNKKVLQTNHITFWNFYKHNYYNEEKVKEIEKFVKKIKINKNDIVFCVGS